MLFDRIFIQYTLFKAHGLRVHLPWTGRVHPRSGHYRLLLLYNGKRDEVLGAKSLVIHVRLLHKNIANKLVRREYTVPLRLRRDPAFQRNIINFKRAVK